MKIVLKVLLILTLIFLIIAGITTLQKFATEPREEFLQGQMEARRVLVAGKIPGRLERLFVHEGDMVVKDSLVAIISSRELEAKKLQAEGALGAAKAQSNKANTGARAEEITALKAMKERAQDAADLAKTTFDRVQKLYNDGVIPLQKRDEAETQMKTAVAAATAAKAQYEQAVAGARVEDKAAANALVIQARGANAEVDAYLDETKIRAPISGEVSLKLAEEGEIVGAGMPVIAITDLNDSWAVFHIREDFLKHISKGKTFTVQIPALDKTIEMVVTYIASVGDYATWRSSKESGGYDLKSFEIRMRPKTTVENLRPGMSVLFPMEQIQ
ncbi:MAG TPA: efflux RND transporter periplasmic adaptor subunit [Fibrobacteraceae bacterium]|jgi:HlyD family secretion protein|nr:efflux RND transporter periplasmic adaptor subunit [Fibrobacteraceae bacterium]